MEKQIAFVKTAWSEYYQGGQVFGRHAYIRKEGEGHEACNFLPNKGSQYLAYIPPIDKKFRPPQPKEKEGWLIIFSAYHGNESLTIVGWYRNASFKDEYEIRPEYRGKEPFQLTPKGDRFKYCVSADAGHLILPEQRNVVISGTHFRRTPIIYIEGVGKKGKWRREFSKLAKSLVEKKQIDNPDIPKIALNFPDPEKRKAVEKAAVSYVLKFLKR